MKIQAEHYEAMKSKIAAIWNAGKHDAHRQFIINEGKAKDVEKRLRWDWMYYAQLSPFVCDNVYPYANDDHVDTALRHIMTDLAG